MKKITEERKENIEPFKFITTANDNDPQVLNIDKERVKVMLYLYRYDFHLFPIIMYGIVCFIKIIRKLKQI